MLSSKRDTSHSPHLRLHAYPYVLHARLPRMVGPMNGPKLPLGTPELICIVNLYWGTGSTSLRRTIDVLQRVTARCGLRVKLRDVLDVVVKPCITSSRTCQSDGMIFECGCGYSLREAYHETSFSDGTVLCGAPLLWTVGMSRAKR